MASRSNKTYEEHLSDLLSHGHREVSIGPPKDDSSLKDNRLVHKIRIKIFAIDKHTGERKRMRHFIEKDFVSEEEFKKRLHYLNGIYRGAIKGSTTRVRKKKLTINESVEDLLRQHQISQAEHYNFSPAIDWSLPANKHPTRELQDKVRMAKRTNNYDLISQGGYHWKKFCSEKGVQTWRELQDSDEITSQYRRWLLTQTYSRGEGFANEKGPLTLNFKTIKKRLEYVKKHLVNHVNKYEKVTRSFDNEMKPFNKKEQEEINFQEIGNRRTIHRMPVDHGDACKIFKALPFGWKMPYATLMILGSRQMETCTIREVELDMIKRRIYKKGSHIEKYQGIRVDSRTKNSIDFQYFLTDELHELLTLYLVYRRRWMATHGIKTPFLFFVDDFKKTSIPGLARRNNFLNAFKKACLQTGVDSTQIDLHSARLTKSINAAIAINTRDPDESAMVSNISEAIEHRVKYLMKYSARAIQHSVKDTEGKTAFKHYWNGTPEPILAELEEKMKTHRIGFDIEYFRQEVRSQCSSLVEDPGPSSEYGV